MMTVWGPGGNEARGAELSARSVARRMLDRLSGELAIAHCMAGECRWLWGDREDKVS
jgi:hypothetical protein